MADDFPAPPGVDATVTGVGPPPNITKASAVLEIWTADGAWSNVTLDSTTPAEAAAVLRWLAAWVTGDRLDAEGQRGHVLHLGDRAAALMHPSECRPDLLSCKFEVARSVLDDPGLRGYYRCTLDDNGWLVIGEKVAD